MASGDTGRGGQQEAQQGECSGFVEKSHSTPRESSQKGQKSLVTAHQEPGTRNRRVMKG